MRLRGYKCWAARPRQALRGSRPISPRSGGPAQGRTSAASWRQGLNRWRRCCRTWGRRPPRSGRRRFSLGRIGSRRRKMLAGVVEGDLTMAHDDEALRRHLLSFLRKRAEQKERDNFEQDKEAFLFH